MSRSYPAGLAGSDFTINVADHEIPVIVAESMEPGRVILTPKSDLPPITWKQLFTPADDKPGILGELDRLGHNGNW